MKTYNRSPDDCTNLQTVVVNKRHKIFIDQMDGAKRAAWARAAADFYRAPFEEQEEKIKEILGTFGLGRD